MKAFACSLVLLTCLASAHAQSAMTSKQVFEKATAASVLVLTGEGAGRVHGIGTGVIVSADGVILTALHVVKGVSEVQVRMSNGEVFDRVQLLGSDERRDVAALKITGRGLPFLDALRTKSLGPGDAVYAVTSANGLSWSATSGIVSALRPADEISGAGTGFRLIQFNAPVAPGASGGALVDDEAKLLGVITSGMGGAAFAVPADSVLGLSESTHPVLLGSGALLQMPAKQNAAIPSSSAAVANTDAKQVVKDARTIYLHSKTMFLTIDTLQRALLSNKQWPELGLTIVGDPSLGDLVIEVDRPLFTYVHTFVLSDRKTTVVIGSGKQTAFDGVIASSGLAKDIVKILAAYRLPKAEKKP